MYVMSPTTSFKVQLIYALSVIACEICTCITLVILCVLNACTSLIYVKASVKYSGYSLFDEHTCIMYIRTYVRISTYMVCIRMCMYAYVLNYLYTYVHTFVT